MMWGDIAEHNPAIVPQLPKNLIVLPWAYDARASFDTAILPFTKFGLRFMVCPGVSCWNQMWPNLQNATVNISNFIRDGAKHGAMGSLNTCWDDDGQNLYNDNWYELAWGAECSWKPVAAESGKNNDDLRTERVNEFNGRFPGVFYGLGGSSAAEALNGLSALRRNSAAGNLGNSAFWRDPAATYQALKDKAALVDLNKRLQPIKRELRHARTRATHNAGTLDYAVFAADQVQYIVDSLNTAERKAGGTKLAHTMSKLEQRYKDLWLRENRPWWLDRNLNRYHDMERKLAELK